MTILIAVLAVVGWTFVFLGIMDKSEEKNPMDAYHTCMDRASDYMERGLYQKAISEYKTAVAEKNLEEDWIHLMNAYQSRYEENDEVYSEYLESMKKAANEYTSNPVFCKKVVELCAAEEDYQTAYQYLSRAKHAGVDDPEIEALYIKNRYAFCYGEYYYDFLSLAASSDCLISCYQQKYGMMDLSGSSAVKCIYNMIGPLGEAGCYVFSDDETSGIMDTNKVLQGKFSFIPEDAGVYSEGFVAVKKDGKWGYYNLVGDYQFGTYEEAGSFFNGFAAVKSEGSWKVIDKDGTEVSDSYEDIRLNPNQSYLAEGVMLAKENGKWHIYKNDGKKQIDFECEDIDLLTEDHVIAFKKDGLWGFVDWDGTVLLEPVYEQARSFSNGLAAVCMHEKWGFIDEEFNLVMDCQWEDAGYFTEKGICPVQFEGDSWNYIKRYVNE